MARLELEFVGFNDALNTMTINGKHPKLIKNKATGNTSCVIKTEKTMVEVVVKKATFYSVKNWFWWNLLYFIISVFGIFDIRENKRSMVVDCKLNIKLEGDKKVTLKVLNFEDGGKLLEVDSQTEVEEISNVQYLDKEGQKKRKKMKKAKLAIVFGAVILSAVLIFVI